MKNLPPSLREKSRYLKFEIHSEEDLNLGEVVETVWDSSISYLGVKGCSEANFWVIGNQYNKETGEGIIKVERDMVSDFRAGLTLIDNFDGKEGFIEIKNISGSIKNLKDS